MSSSANTKHKQQSTIIWIGIRRQRWRNNDNENDDDDSNGATGNGIRQRWRCQWWRRDGRWDTLTMAHKNELWGHRNELWRTYPRYNYFWIHSKSSLTLPATCFECYDGTGTEMGRGRFQRWVGCNFGTLKKSCDFSSVNTFPPNLEVYVSISSVLYAPIAVFLLTALPLVVLICTSVVSTSYQLS